MARWAVQEPAAGVLADAAAGGDSAARAILFDVYAERLFDYCRSLGGDPVRAADVTCATLVAVGQRAAQVEPGQVRAWVYATARRGVLAGGRVTALVWECVPAAEVAAAEAAEHFDALQAAPEGPARGGPYRDTGDEAADGPVDERCRQIRRVVVALSPADQEALFLAERHGLDTAELCMVLNTTRGRVRTRLRRARAWLRECLPEGEAAGALDRHAAPEPPGGLRSRALATGTPDAPGHRRPLRAGPALVAPRTRRLLLAGTALAATIAIAWLGPVDDATTPLRRWPFSSPPGASMPRPVPSTPGATPEPLPPAGPDRPTPTPAPETSRTGSVSPSPAGSPTRPVRLAVRPEAIAFAKEQDTASIHLRATGEAITWSAASSSGQLSVSPARGQLPAGRETTVYVRLNRNALTLTGKATITFTGNAGDTHPVHASWIGSVL